MEPTDTAVVTAAESSQPVQSSTTASNPSEGAALAESKEAFSDNTAGDEAAVAAVPPSSTGSDSVMDSGNTPDESALKVDATFGSAEVAVDALADSVTEAVKKDATTAPETNGTAEGTDTGATGENEEEAPKADAELEKLREAARKRRLRRIASRTQHEGNAAEEAPKSEASGDANPGELKRLREELTAARVEMASMRRNHVTNVQKLTSERDMFAMQLSKEQEQVTPESKRGMEELRTELQSAKLRVKNMEEENSNMRNELKELRLRMQAHKTLDAANNGYEEVLDNLITVKLQLATVSEEKESLVYENRVLKSDNEGLSAANGMLEKSRAEWVTKCAELEQRFGEKTSSVADAALSEAPESAFMKDASSRSEKSMSLNSEQLDQVSLG